MKNKKRLVILIVLAILIVVSILISVMFFLRRNNITDILINSSKAKNFSVEISEYYDWLGDGEYTLENTQNFAFNTKNFEYINEEGFNEYYYYNGDLILSNEKFSNADELYWYYKPEGVFTSKEYGYLEYFQNLFEALKNLSLKKEKDVYVYKNTIKMNDDFEDGITEYVYAIYDLGEGTSDDYDYIYQVSNIKIKASNDLVEEIIIDFNQSCYEKAPDYCTEKKRLEIKFDDYNEIKDQLPSEVVKGLEETTAGNWVGEYKNTITCPDGKSYEETINLTDKFEWVFGLGWNAEIENYDCNDGYYNVFARDYNIVDNKLVVYDTFDDVLVEFNFYENYFQEVDDNGKVISEFKKVN